MYSVRKLKFVLSEAEGVPSSASGELIVGYLDEPVLFDTELTPEERRMLTELSKTVVRRVVKEKQL